MLISQETHTCSFKYSGFLCSPDASSTGLILKSSTFFSNRVANTRAVQVDPAKPTTVKPMATDHNRLLANKPTRKRAIDAQRIQMRVLKEVRKWICISVP